MKISAEIKRMEVLLESASLQTLKDVSIMYASPKTKEAWIIRAKLNVELMKKMGVPAFQKFSRKNLQDKESLRC